VKKILICSRASSLIGGVESINHALCRELAPDKWDVRLALTKGARFNRPEQFVEAYPQFQIIEIDGTGGTRQARLEALLSLFRKEKPDIILNMRVFDVYEAAARYKRESPETRLIAGIRCFETPLLYDVRLYRENVDFFVTSGELIARCCRDWAGIDALRIANIPGGIHIPEKFSPRSRFSEPIRLGYVGRLEQGQKRIFDLLSMLSELDRREIDYVFELAGKGPDEAVLLDRLKPWIDMGRVCYHGFVSEEVLYTKVYPNIDVFVHFAHTEGVTIAPREAMAHGSVPVISRFSGLEEEGLYRDGENCLVFNVGEPVQAVEHIIRLKNDANLFRLLSEKAIASQHGKYSYYGSIRAWETIFAKSLAMPSLSGKVPRVLDHDTGRLKRWIPSAWLRQRIRNLCHIHPQHNDPGGEWPTNSGSMPTEDADAITRCLQSKKENST